MNHVCCEIALNTLKFSLLAWPLNGLRVNRRSIGCTVPVFRGTAVACLIRGEAGGSRRNISVLDAVYSFPTTIFWPLDGEPTIHQGFNGPATGVGYEVEKTFFRSELNRITGRSENR